MLKYFVETIENLCVLCYNRLINADIVINYQLFLFFENYYLIPNLKGVGLFWKNFSN